MNKPEIVMLMPTPGAENVRPPQALELHSVTGGVFAISRTATGRTPVGERDEVIRRLYRQWFEQSAGGAA